MKRRIFFSVLLTSMLVLIITVSVTLLTVYDKFSSERKAEIRGETDYIASAYELSGIDAVKAAGSVGSNRVTLISESGAVLFDSFADASALENHASRPEIAQAIASGSGEAVRNSDTLRSENYYYAKSLSDGNVIRVAASMKTVLSLVDDTTNFILLTAAAALLLSIAAAFILTKIIIAPINKIDLDSPTKNVTYGELSPLLVRMDKQNEKIAEQIRKLTRRQNELGAIIDGMSEALVVFAADGKVLVANSSAELLFSSYLPIGRDYIELCRDGAYTSAVKKALGGERVEECFSRGGRTYRLTVSPVPDDSSYAAVLFAVDITEAENAEQMRREFSANVSHELKTPLTSILGYAEIMSGGIARNEDFPRFSGLIYSEAKRLLALIEDIIKLSKLDENSLAGEFADVDLHILSEKVRSELKEKAERLNVEIDVRGESLCVKGIENVLHEMVFNLCDNAVTYNRDGGTVTVSTEKKDGKAALTVEDNGIGIAPEHQSRIFERFYRVDKSHSRETGGTGLGLSIVKHGALLHSAEIKVTSALGKGCKIEVFFPLK